MDVSRAVAAEWLARGTPCAIVSVEQARGSSPREAGTRMLVSAAAQVGTIGGGHLEFEAVRRARAALASGVWPPPVDFALGAALGQCCGGTVRVAWTALSAEEVARWPTPAVRFELMLFGAGHVARALARILAVLPCRVTWVDERADEFPQTLGTPAWPAHVTTLAVDAVEAEVAAAAPGSCFAVMTHDHQLDLRIVEAVLRRGDFRYLGLIGSKAKRARFVRQLETKGLSCERLVCPIGVVGVQGKEPEVIAVAVAAQLLSLPAAMDLRAGDVALRSEE